MRDLVDRCLNSSKSDLVNKDRAAGFRYIVPSSVSANSSTSSSSNTIARMNIVWGNTNYFCLERFG